MNDGDGEIKRCSNCGEGLYLFDAEDIKLCPRCGGVVSQSARQDVEDGR